MTEQEVQQATAEPEDDRRMMIRIANGNRMSRGKYAAQAVHAALALVGAHPGCAVIVLGATKDQVLSMPVCIHDAGATELEPGTLTAGAEWEES